VSVPDPSPAIATAVPARTRSATPIALGALGLVVAAGLVGWMSMRGGAAAPSPVPVPAPMPLVAPETSQAEVEKLLAQLNSDSDTQRRSAAERLRHDFARSPLAVGLAVNQLSTSNFQSLSKEGRIELFGFLLAADEAAWTADRRIAAADAVRRIRQRLASGKAQLVPEVLELLDRVGQRVGA
jgi:hypothetical protein